MVEVLGDDGIAERFIDPLKFGIKNPIVEYNFFNNRTALDIIV